MDQSAKCTIFELHRDVWVRGSEVDYNSMLSLVRSLHQQSQAGAIDFDTCARYRLLFGPSDSDMTGRVTYLLGEAEKIHRSGTSTSNGTRFVGDSIQCTKFLLACFIGDLRACAKELTAYTKRIPRENRRHSLPTLQAMEQLYFNSRSGERE